MYFLDKESNRVKNCLDCGAVFLPEKGAICPLNCPAKQLEIKHENLVSKMIIHCLSKEKITFISPKTTPIISDEWNWGWTDDIKKIIYIPWYTLRSKKEFFETVPHEIGHITAYKKLFKLPKRKILYTFDILRLRHKTFSLWITKIVLGKYYIRYREVIDKYRDWEGHDSNPWHRQYLRFHKKLIKSLFVKYAYGNIKSRSYGFNKDGSGKCDPNKR